MKGTVHYETRGEIALLSIDNPPVNPLSSGVRQGLFDGMTKALADEAVKAVVITGLNRAFIAGADIEEIKELKTKEQVDLAVSSGQEIFNMIEDLMKAIKSIPDAPSVL